MSARKHGHEWWEERSTGEKIAAGFFIGLLIIGLMSIFGLVTKALWNALMPDIFGLPTITYWQAWGLLLLSMIFFKNFGSDKSSRRERKRKRELGRYMSEEERNGGSQPQQSSPAGASAPGAEGSGPANNDRGPSAGGPDEPGPATDPAGGPTA